MPRREFEIRNSLFNLAQYNNSAPSRLQGFEDLYRRSRSKPASWDKVTTVKPTITPCKFVSMNDLGKCPWLECGIMRNINLSCMPLAKKMQDLAASPNLNFDGTTNDNERLQNEIIKSLSAVNGNRLDNSKKGVIVTKSTKKINNFDKDLQNCNNDVIIGSRLDEDSCKQNFQESLDSDSYGKIYTPIRQMASMPIVHKSEGHDKENKNNKTNSDTKIVANQIKELSLTENITEKKSTLSNQQNALQEVKSSPVLGDKTSEETHNHRLEEAQTVVEETTTPPLHKTCSESSLRVKVEKKIKRNRSVHFADSRGLDLEVRFLFNQSDDYKTPPKLKEALDKIRGAEAQNDLFRFPKRSTIDSFTSSCGQHSLVATFTQPFLAHNFQNRVLNQSVCLESVSLFPNSLSLTGVIRVCNICFHKQVFIRYTTDQWRTYKDMPARYVSSVPHINQDQFSFHLVASEMKGGETIQIAIGFRTPYHEYWDNNDGANYVISCVNRPSSPSCDAARMMA